MQQLSNIHEEIGGTRSNTLISGVCLPLARQRGLFMARTKRPPSQRRQLLPDVFVYLTSHPPLARFLSGCGCPYSFAFQINLLPLRNGPWAASDKMVAQSGHKIGLEPLPANLIALFGGCREGWVKVQSSC